jgi:site-specific DNA recombinase
MNKIRAAFYARVSGEQQAAAHTIESQIAALSKRAQADWVPVPPERQFLDDGYTGATLIRPAMDRLRDLAAVGGIDRIYVHSPDRLARNYAYQVLLIEEWHRTGVDIVFLNRPLGKSPEDDLLLQVQGIVSEYERAKIMERYVERAVRLSLRHSSRGRRSSPVRTCSRSGGPCEGHFCVGWTGTLYSRRSMPPSAGGM